MTFGVADLPESETCFVKDVGGNAYTSVYVAMYSLFMLGVVGKELFWKFLNRDEMIREGWQHPILPLWSLRVGVGIAFVGSTVVFCTGIILMGRSPECDDPETKMFNYLLGILFGSIAVLLAGMSLDDAEREIVRFLLEPSRKMGDPSDPSTSPPVSNFRRATEELGASELAGMKMYGGVGWRIRKVFWRFFFSLLPLALFYHSLYWYYNDDFRLLAAACDFENNTLNQVFGANAELLYFESERTGTDPNEERVWTYEVRFLCDEMVVELLFVNFNDTGCPPIDPNQTLPEQSLFQETIFETSLDRVDNSFANRSLLCSLTMSFCLIVIILTSELARLVDENASGTTAPAANGGNLGGWVNNPDDNGTWAKYAYTGLKMQTFRTSGFWDQDGRDAGRYVVNGQKIGGFFAKFTGQHAKRLRTAVDSNVMPTLFSYAAYGGAMVTTFISIFYVLQYECTQYRFTPGISSCALFCTSGVAFSGG